MRACDWPSTPRSAPPARRRNGKAVGARPDGIVYHQLAGATSTNSGDGPQRIELRRFPPGKYQLLLRRVAEGSGEIVLTAGPDELRFPVDRVGEAVRVELEVSVVDGKLRVRPLNVRAVDLKRIERHERVIITELAKKRAISIAEQRRQHAADAAPPPGRERPERSPQRPDIRPKPRATSTARPSDARPRPTNRRPDTTPARPGDTDSTRDPLSLCRRLLDSADLNDESTVAVRCRALVDEGVTTARVLCRRLDASGDLKKHPQLAKRCRTALNGSTPSSRARPSNAVDGQRGASARFNANGHSAAQRATGPTAASAERRHCDHRTGRHRGAPLGAAVTARGEASGAPSPPRTPPPAWQGAPSPSLSSAASIRRRAG